MGLLVIDPGLFTTIQDTGRPGFRQWGVPPSGAFDRPSAALANALVANPESTPLLELTLRGGTYVATYNLALALAGAPMPARIIHPDGSHTDLHIPQSFSLKPQHRLTIGFAPHGARTYLAVHGGWIHPKILESASTEISLEANHQLLATPSQIPARRLAHPPVIDPTNGPIRIIDAPDSHSFHSDDPTFWHDRGFRVTPQSNRMGLRLQSSPIDATVPAHRLSIPVGPGAIQLAGGQLIILGIACGTMGGYPLIAHVISADLHRLAQLRPSDTIHFERVSLQLARDLDRQCRQTLARDLTRIRVAVQGE
jgi:biotin-dependent carboxylase-like uncharacterized protein